jgi:DNA-directed RNA polymerase specialized sigma24 family protein
VQPIKKDLKATSPPGGEGHNLIIAVRQGDPEGLSKLYDRYGAIIYGFITRIVGDPDIAEKVLQNSFITIWKSMPAFDPKKERILTWMLKITMSVSISALPDLEKEPEEIGPDDLSNLNTVITLIFFKGLSLEQAARKIDVPLNLLIPKMKMAFKQLLGGQSQ